jgi:hypothetical protein
MDQGLSSRPQISHIIDSVLDLLNIYNERFEEIQEELRVVQPREAGATLMYLSRHSEKQPTCFGCPHIDWKRTGLTGGKGEKFLTLRRITGNPVMQVRRQGRFLDIHDQVQALIGEARDLEAEKKKFTKVLGNLSRMISYRFDVPEFGERLDLYERGEILKEHIILRLNDIDHSLQRWSQELNELQPGTFPLKVFLAFRRCSRGCDFCPHPHWAIYRKVRGESGETKIEAVRVEKPLVSLPRNPKDPEKVDKIRSIVRNVQSLLREREGYSDKVSSLTRMYRAKFELAHR